METIKGITSTGYEYAVDANFRDDWDILEALSKLTSEDEADAMFATVELARLLLGKEQLKKLKEHCKNDSGRPSTTKMSAEIMEIFKGVGKGNEVKNS